MENIIPIKRFGQNYLKDKNIIDKIVREINPEPDDQIIEIGPGLGALTERIIKLNNNLTLIEIDKRVIEQLKTKFPAAKYIEGDFLKIDLAPILQSGRKVKVAGNIPYNITSPILFKLLSFKDKINESVLMVQDEVARRITAEYNTKDYGILSVIMSRFTEVKYCFRISPNVFYPKPKVYSALIHIFFRANEKDDLDDDIFIKVVKASFGHRRKTLKNSLSNSIFRDCNFSGINIDFSKRAEQLTVSEFEYLTKMLQCEFNE
jgi:16S rRNA (adenine1518-N6/adenine1519-N6)-dimethyltransferase